MLQYQTKGYDFTVNNVAVMY